MNLRPFLVPLASVLLLSCSSNEPGSTGRMVDLGTHRLHAVVSGAGTPAVVFDGGIGARCDEYLALQERLATETTVVIYDRAGYGSSEGGPLPRDSGTEAGELRAMLAELGVPAPHVLVGHSLGGLNVEIFAHRYPDDVAGLVLLDPPPLSFISGRDWVQFIPLAERMTGEWQEIADRGLGSEDARERAEAVFLQMLASEHREMLGRSAQLASAIETFGDMPLVVMASGKPNPLFGDEAADYQRYWADQSASLAAKSSEGRFVLAEESGHRLHEEAADLVVESILSVLESGGVSR